jgi:hypothetical protein
MKTMITAALLATTAAFRPFDPAGWKMNDDGNGIAVKDGNPIWVEADGTEKTMGGDTISLLNSDMKKVRTKLEAAEAERDTLKTKFADLDPDKARAALDTIKNIDQKKLIDAGEVDKVRDSMRNEFQTLVDKATAERDAAINEANTVRLESAFTGSKFIAEKLAIPRDMVQATFGKNFKIEDGKIAAYGADGNRVMSKEKIGEFAGFEEAISIIVDHYPQRDMILKGANHGGSGNNGGGGGGAPGKQRYTRAEYEKLPPKEQQRIGLEAGQGKAEIVDA